MIGNYFAVLDKDKDGALEGGELAAAQAMMGSRRRSEAAPPTAPAAGAK